MPPRLEALSAALSRRASPARFWWRDDDAVAPTSALDHLLDLSATYSAPCLLAVIPEPTGPSLAARLTEAPLLAVAVHGWSHANHAPSGVKKAELGPHRPITHRLDELSRGLAKLGSLYPGKLVPALVPPWNRIDPALIPELPGIGFSGLSVYGPETPVPLRCVNTHVDVMDWHGTGGGKPASVLEAEIIAALDRDPPAIGILTHHLVHDAAAWGFLSALLALVTAHPATRWVDPGELFASGP